MQKDFKFCLKLKKYDVKYNVSLEGKSPQSFLNAQIHKLN